MSNEFLFKIVLIGSGKVDKTSLIRRYADIKFDKSYLPTHGVDITTKKIIIENYNVKLILVDTAGQEFFGKLRPSYYRGASACIIFFDKQDRDSFNDIPKWYEEFRQYTHSPQVPIAVVGVSSQVPPQPSQYISYIEGKKGNYDLTTQTKLSFSVDIMNNISSEEAQALMEQLDNCTFFNCTLTNKNELDVVVEHLVKEFLSRS